jgi:hypothetical protein
MAKVCGKHPYRGLFPATHPRPGRSWPLREGPNFPASSGDNPMKTTHGNNAELAAQIQLLHAPVRAALVSRILGLSENGGMTDHAIAAVLDLPLALVRMTIRGHQQELSK